MKRLSIILIALCTVASSHAATDPVRAGMFKMYAISASKALAAQDGVLVINAGEHLMSKQEMDKLTNFQKQFNEYLKNFNDIITLAAEIYGIYYEVDHTIKNLKELKSSVVAVPANTLAVALNKSKNHIYQEVIDDGIQIAADVKQLIPLSKDGEKNAKMTQWERIECIGKIRKTLRSLNAKLRKMNRLIRYTSLMDSWYELKGRYYKPKSMYTICDMCKTRWMSRANTAAQLNCKK